MAKSDSHHHYLEQALAELCASPLSRRRAMLVAYLIAAQVDRLFVPGPAGDDILDYRARLVAQSPALGLVLALCREDTTLRVVTQAVAVPLADYGTLSVEDFMVSLYNDHSVQRLMLVGDGPSRDMLALLEEAVAALGLPENIAQAEER